MRRSHVFICALCIAGAALASTDPTSNRLSTEGKGFLNGDGAMAPRTGGEDVTGAALIPTLPFSDTGATCGYVNDYDEVCPYTGSKSTDVVYQYTPAAEEAITVDLCSSQYDTKVYIYAGGVGNLTACNDDAGCGYSGWQSKVTDVSLSAGVTYYIVVDGYGGGCGTYSMSIMAFESCVVECPPGSQIEGEPPCGPDYVDGYNGGCQSDPQVFQPLAAYPTQWSDLCGRSGTYTYQGLSYRDTDWFEAQGQSQTAWVECTAEFPLQLILIWRTDCDDLGYDITTVGACQTATLTHWMPNGAPLWIWVGPQVFSGVPCDADYLLHFTGIYGIGGGVGGIPEPGAPPRGSVEERSWGRIKAQYR